jgi:Tol biopolymer transport system component
VTGYDFLASGPDDGAQAVTQALGAYIAAQSTTTIFSNDWTRSSLVGPGGAFIPSTGQTPAVTSLNGHADYYGFQPADESGGIVTVDDVVLAGALAFDGRLVFSMGCHAGLSLEDVFSGLTPSASRDWAQSFAGSGAAAFAGNTGFGFGDTEVRAYGEELNRIFARNMASGRMTFGEALSAAKQEYLASLGVVGVYDEKTAAEFTLFGLPMWRLDKGGFTVQALQAAPVTSTTVVDPLTGLSAQKTTITPSFTTTGTLSGEYLVGGAGIQVSHLRPVQPKEIVPVTIPNAHGALVTSLTSSLVSNTFDPVYSRPTIDERAAEPELAYNDVVFPAKLQSVNVSRGADGTATRQLVLVTGQFEGDPDTVDKQGIGRETRFDKVSTLVYGTGPGREHLAPVFSLVDAYRIGTEAPYRAGFSVRVTDRTGTGTGGQVKRVLVAYQDGDVADWRFLDLAQDPADPTLWTGIGDLTNPSFQYFAQAVDASGNVGVTSNKGSYYAFSHVAEQPTTASPPRVVIAQPTDASAGGGAGIYVVGEPLTASFACIDPDSVVVSCTATLDGTDIAQGATIDTSSSGQRTLTVAAVDAAGVTTKRTITFYVVGVGLTPAPGISGWNTGDVTVSVTGGVPAELLTGVTLMIDNTSVKATTATVSVDGAHTAAIVGPTGATSAPVSFKIDRTAPLIAITVPTAGATYSQGQSVTVTYSCTDGTGSGVASCTGTVPSGSALDTSSTGNNKVFSVVTTDQAGNSRTIDITYNVAFGLAGKTVFARGGDIWAIDASAAQPVAVNLTPGPDIDSEPARSPDGTAIIFARRPAKGTVTTLYLYDGTGVRRVIAGTSCADLNPVPVEGTAPTWSPDGTKIAFQSAWRASKGIDVWTATLTRSGTCALAVANTVANLTNVAGDDRTPTWSPVAATDPRTSLYNRIAFSANRSKGSYKLYMRTLGDTSGATEVRITIGSNDDVEPSWSPDGATIAFSSNFAGGTGGFEIHLTTPQPDSSKTRITTIDGADGQPVWIAGGTSILFVSNRSGSATDPSAGLYTMRPTASSAPVKVAGTAPGDRDPG